MLQTIPIVVDCACDPRDRGLPGWVAVPVVRDGPDVVGGWGLHAGAEPDFRRSRSARKAFLIDIIFQQDLYFW
ncbi:MAG: hypothetical protein ABGZ17_19640, partial [Planctomycetaceae bacterium]